LQVVSEQNQIAETRGTLRSRDKEIGFPEEPHRSFADDHSKHDCLSDDNVASLESQKNSSDHIDEHETANSQSASEAFVDVADLTASAFNLDDSADNVYLLQPPDMSNLDDDYFAFQQDIISAAGSSSEEDDNEAMDTCAFQTDELGMQSVLDQHEEEDGYKPNNSGENMTLSMQSLIDGLMTWGGEEEPVNDIGYQTEGNGRGMKSSSLLE
jgi:hypothetical protein